MNDMERAPDYWEAIEAGWTFHRNGSSGRGFFARMTDAGLAIDPGQELAVVGYDDDGEPIEGPWFPDDHFTVPRDIIVRLAALTENRSASDERIARWVEEDRFTDDESSEGYVLVMVAFDEPDRSLDCAFSVEGGVLSTTHTWRGDRMCARWRATQGLEA